MIERTYKTISFFENYQAVVVEFKEKKYELLSTLLFSDGNAIGKLVLEKMEEISEGKVDRWEITGNVCRVELSRTNVKVYDTLADEEEAACCELEPSDMCEILREWLEINQNSVQN